MRSDQEKRLSSNNPLFNPARRSEEKVRLPGMGSQYNE